MTKFNEFTDAVLKDATVLAKDIFNGFEGQAAEVAEAFLEKTKADVQRWCLLLADQKLTEQDFSDLVSAKRALAEIHVLTISGIALTKIERFRTGLIDSVIDRAFSILL
jgi:hypothetical protein